MVIKYKVDESRPFYGKFWPKGVPHQLDYDYSMTLGQMLADAAKKWPNDPAMWFLDSWMDYKTFKDYVDRFATALTNMGMKKGDTLAIHLANCMQYEIAYFAGATIGVIVTGINPTYKPMEILHQVKLTNAKYIVVLDALYFHYVKPFRKDWDFEKIIYTNLVDLATGMSGIKKWLGKKLKKIPTAKVEHPNAISFMECLKTPPNLPKVEIDAAEDVATLIMTGGTTGIPKAAVLTHQNCVSNAMMLKEMLLNQKEEGSKEQLGHKTCSIGVLPLYHSFAMSVVMNICIATGGYQALFPKPPPAEELLDHIQKLPNYNGFIYAGAEILFQRISTLEEDVLKKFDITGRLKLCLSGAGPLHDYVRDPFEAKTGAKITEGYGLSEASPVVSANNLYGYRESGWIGVPTPSTDWDIFDSEDFSKGPVGELGEEKGTGEICCTGPQVMKEYWQMPDRTAATLKEYDGRTWLLTGDIGFMDEHGRIKIRDRKKQLIKMAGHSVFPAEVESLIGNHPKVLEVAVAGLPDMKTGEAVKAWVALKPEHVGTITPEELIAWANENMTRWKCPKYLEFIDELPKSTVGKVMRRTLQEADPLWDKKD